MLVRFSIKIYTKYKRKIFFSFQNFFLKKNFFFLEEKFFFFKIQGNDPRIENTRQNVMKPKYVYNVMLKRLWFTSDDFLKKFRGPDENIMTFQNIFIRPSKLFQKVIRSEPEGRTVYVKCNPTKKMVRNESS